MNEVEDLKLLLKEFKAELSTSGKEKQVLFFEECLHEIEHGVNSQGVSSAIRLVAGSAKLAQFVDFTDVESKLHNQCIDKAIEVLESGLIC